MEEGATASATATFPYGTNALNALLSSFPSAPFSSPLETTVQLLCRNKKLALFGKKLCTT